MLLINSNRTETIGKLFGDCGKKHDWIEMPENGVILLDKIQAFSKKDIGDYHNSIRYTIFAIEFYCRDKLVVYFRYYDAVSRDEDFLNIVDAIRRHSVGS